MHWEGENEQGFPVVDADDPSVYAELLRRAARLSRSGPAGKPIGRSSGGPAA